MRNKPILFNTRLREFRNNKLRENAWLAVNSEIDANGSLRIILRGKIDLNKARKHGVFGFQWSIQFPMVCHTLHANNNNIPHTDSRTCRKLSVNSLHWNVKWFPSLRIRDPYTARKRQRQRLTRTDTELWKSGIALILLNYELSGAALQCAVVQCTRSHRHLGATRRLVKKLAQIVGIQPIGYNNASIPKQRLK